MGLKSRVSDLSSACTSGSESIRVKEQQTNMIRTNDSQLMVVPNVRKARRRRRSHLHPATS